MTGDLEAVRRLVQLHADSLGRGGLESLRISVVPAEDPPALKNALEQLLANPDLARRVGDEARRHCAASFSYQGMLDKMERIYLQVLR